MSKIAFCAILGAVLLATEASAAPIPQPVEALIRAAGPDRIDAVAAVAKTTNPNSVAEIDALVSSLKAEAAARRREALASQGFFEGWGGEGQFGGFVTSGNTKDNGFNIGIVLNKDGLTWRHHINALADFQTAGGKRTREAYRLGYEADYAISQRWYAYGLLQWERDKFALLDRRFTEAVGVGYIVLNEAPFSLTVDGGPAFRQTRYITPAFSKNQVASRITGKFAWDIRDGLKFTEDLGTLIGSGDSTLYSRTALTAAIMGNMSARVSFDVNHETSPPAGVKKTDTATRFTVVYSF